MQNGSKNKQTFIFFLQKRPGRLSGRIHKYLGTWADETARGLVQTTQALGQVKLPRVLNWLDYLGPRAGETARGLGLVRLTRK